MKPHRQNSSNTTTRTNPSFTIKKQLNAAYSLLKAYSSLEKKNKSDLNNVHLALEYFKEILEVQSNNDNALLGAGNCYSFLNQHNEAISTYNILENNSKALLSLARCYQEIGDYAKAVTTFQNIPDLANDKTALLGLARCYAEMGQYREAEQMYENMIMKWRADEQILVSLARCYEEMGNYDTAVTTFERIPDLGSHKTGLLGLARCYAEMGQYRKAEKMYENMIRKWRADEQILISFARCYEEEEDYVQAEATLQMIESWETNKKALLSLGYVSKKSGDVSGAIDYLQRIKNWETDNNALLALAGIQADCGFARLAIETYQKIPKWEQQLGICLKIAKIYYSVALAENESARILYQSCIEKWPNSVKAQHEYNVFLFKTDSIDDAEANNNRLQEQWPYFYDAYFLKAKIHRKKNEDQLQNATLQRTISQLAYLKSAYLVLIRYYLDKSDVGRAQYINKLFLERFPQDVLFRKKIDQAFDSRHFNYLSDKFYDNDSCVIQKPLHAQSSRIQELVQQITESGFEGSYYLVGGATRAMIEGEQSLSERQTIDIVAFQEPCLNLDFTQSPLPQLYVGHDWYGRQIHWYHLPEKKIMSLYSERDFTIGALLPSLNLRHYQKKPPNGPC